MTLSAKDLAEITRALEQSSFDEVHLEIDGLKLYLSRGAALSRDAPTGALATASGATARPGPAAPMPVATAPAAHGAPARQISTSAATGAHEVTAPMLGTFYRAPKPGAPPYVDVGTRVEPDSIIGIIEVMKLMNTVRAGVQGEVLEILAEDGVMVEYGAALMRIADSHPPSSAARG